MEWHAINTQLIKVKDQLSRSTVGMLLAKNGSGPLNSTRRQVYFLDSTRDVGL